MVDTNILMRDLLLSSTAITSLLGANANGGIYCGDLPEHFDPALGPGITIHTVDGSPHDEITPLVDDRKQVRVWANVEKYLAARQLYGAVRDLLHGNCGADFGADGHVIRCLESKSGQDVTDPETGWATVVAFYQIMAR